MPYITRERRLAIDTPGTVPQDAGELNYMLTKAMLRERATHVELRVELRLIAEIYIKAAPLRYARINDVLGAFFGAALEYERRTGDVDGAKSMLRIAKDFYTDIGVPYEKTKIMENGDLYP